MYLSNMQNLSILALLVSFHLPNIQIWEIGIFRPVSFKFILETVQDRGSPWTHFRKFSTQSIQQKTTSKFDEK